jgi:polyisoprenyl-teichoic acid--peptidoglycan teichoic acid transferase
MMPKTILNYLHRIPLLFVLAIFLVGCATPAAVGMPLAAAPATATATPSPTYVTAPPDATATPTPFQPLPPTAVYLPTETPLPTATPLPPKPTSPPPKVKSQRGSIKQPDDQINILLLGSDQRPWDVAFRTDTIILATLNPDLGTVNLTSFPRDLYVTLPGWGMNRINTAYEFGGFPLLASTFEYNFGVRPDHYVLINFASFKKLIDSLGGLEVNVHTAVTDIRAGRYYTVPAGVRKMDADDVLWYVRTRKTTNDFARTRRQQEVLQALFEKMLSLNAIKRVPEFYNIYKESVTTDLNFNDIVHLLPFAAKITDTSRINQYFIGPQQVYDWLTPEGGMVLLPRQDAIMKIMRKALNNN